MENSSYMPRGLKMLSEKMSGFARNRFRLEPQSALSGLKAGNIITVTLPENAVLDMKSLRLYMDVLGSTTGSGGDTVFAKAPSAEGLIQRVEVFINGVSVSANSAEYNTIAQLVKIQDSNTQRDGSMDKAIANSFLDDADAPTNEQMCVNRWHNFLNTAACRYVPTEALGAITIRVTLADNSVLSGKQITQPWSGGYVGAGQAAANQMSYTVNNVYWTVDSIVPDPVYNVSLRERLAVAPLQINYNEYYSFDQAGITGTNTNNRFALSSQSIDKIFATLRNSDYQTVGKIPADISYGTLTSTWTPNYFRFRSYDGGNMSNQFVVNNVSFPQAPSNALESLVNTWYCSDKVEEQFGNLITDRRQYADGYFVTPCILNYPDKDLGVALISGYDSKGTNAQMVFKIDGLSIPVGDAANCMAVARTTQSLIVDVGRQLSVLY